MGEIVTQGVGKEDGAKPVFVNRAQYNDLGVEVVDRSNSVADGNRIRLDRCRC